MAPSKVNFDTSFDSKLDELTNIKWYPWVGTEFSQTNNKLMIVGESMKNWNPSDEDTATYINGTKFLIRDILNQHALNTTSPEPFVRNIEKSIFNKRYPSEKQALKVWNSVIYHNLVLRSMSSINERPKKVDYKEGWKELLKIISITDTRQCILYGTDRRKSDTLISILREKNIIYTYTEPYNKTNRSIPRVINFPYNSNKIKILFIKHPSSYFSWGKWHEIINNEIDFSALLVND